MKNKITPKFIIITIITLVLLLINIILYINKIAIPNMHNKELEEKYNKWLLSNNNKQEEVITEITTEEINAREIEKLKNMGEKSRMQFYFGKFLSYIKEEKYDRAYNLLYDEFKTNYFETQEKFETYVKKTYSKNTAINYSSIERQGYFYVLFIEIINPTTQKKDDENKIEQKIVIKEDDFNNFKLSFEIV